VLISDPHAGPHFGSREMERVVAASNGLRPDVVALLGDFVARFPVDMPVVTRGIADLVAPLGVFAVLGNHDYWIDGAAIERALVKAGVHLLKNSGLPFERGGGRLWLAGLDDMRWGRPNLDAALDGALDGEVVILLVHNPIGVRAAAARGVPLVLSGHTHGGQVRIPGIGPLMLPIRERHFAQGRVQVGPTQLYVNRGVGVGTPPVRLGVRPEVTLIVPRTA